MLEQRRGSYIIHVDFVKRVQVHGGDDKFEKLWSRGVGVPVELGRSIRTAASQGRWRDAHDQHGGRTNAALWQQESAVCSGGFLEAGSDSVESSAIEARNEIL